MKRLPAWTAIVVVLSLALPAGVAFGQQSGVTTPVERRFEAADPPAQTELLQLVLDFAPGAWTPVHIHGGPGHVTVLDGEMTLRMGGADQTFKVGEGWIDSPDMPHAAGNEGRSTARLVVSFVLPKGATPTTVVETGAQGTAPPGPTTVAQFRIDAPSMSGPIDVIHRMTEVAPGATVPMHTHPGPNIVSALEGNVSIEMEGMTHSYQAGDNWVEPANVVHGGSATGSTPTRIVTTTVVPRGAPVTIPAQQAAPAQPKPGAPAPKPAPGAPAPAPKPAAAPAQAPVQAPRALPRTGEAENWLVGSLGAAGAILLGVGLVARRRGI